MTIRTAQRLRELTVAQGTLAITWLAQAGCVFKTPAGTILYVDPYLSDYVYRMHGFKRLMGTPVEADEVEADYVISTHAHGDHLDLDALPIIARNPRTHFVGALDCIPEYERMGLPRARYSALAAGEHLTLGDVTLWGVYADHGEGTPHAIGVVVECGGIRVWQVGDTAYRPERMQDAIGLHPQVIIPPINGAFGNLDGVQAAQLAAVSGAEYAIPCHFWMFAEHNGNPAQFLEACRELAPKVVPVLLSQGETWIYPPERRPS
ncbi:MAG: MBL fold metallo-hydrolase [Chloroflexi bacterium]|nr:MBL fold metallo-hydrolase [Chloroflexota bacterium]